MNLIDTLMHVSHSFGIKKVKGKSYGVSEQPESHCALHHGLLRPEVKGKKQALAIHNARSLASLHLCRIKQDRSLPLSYDIFSRFAF